MDAQNVQAWVTLIAAVGAMVVSIISAVRKPVGLAAVEDRMTAIHVDLNSRLSQLVESTRAAAHAEGIVQGAGLPIQPAVQTINPVQ